jgi:hypothetical protein
MRATDQKVYSIEAAAIRAGLKVSQLGYILADRADLFPIADDDLDLTPFERLAILEGSSSAVLATEAQLERIFDFAVGYGA